jgi:hypothetical protein
MLPPETVWYVIAFAGGVGYYVAKRVLANVVDDGYEAGKPYMMDAGQSVVEDARTRHQRRNSEVNADDLCRAIREDESIDTDSEKSEEEQLTELRDTLQKAKRDLRSPSIDPETLRW